MAKIEVFLDEGRVDPLSVRSKKADRVWFGDEETGVIKGMVKNMARQGDYIVATVLDNMGEYHEVEFFDPMPPDPWDNRTGGSNLDITEKIEKYIGELAEPSKKSPQMQAFLDKQAGELFGRPRTGSIKKNVCVACGKPATKFKDELSKREYSISGLCQKCQDETF